MPLKHYSLHAKYDVLDLAFWCLVHMYVRMVYD